MIPGRGVLYLSDRSETANKGEGTAEMWQGGEMKRWKGGEDSQRRRERAGE